MTSQEKQLYGKGVQVLQRNELYTKYKLTDKTGEVIMTAYDVFPGIRLIYNDMHMKNCHVEVQSVEWILIP